MRCCESNIKERVFLVGCARSGTTLLQSILVSHPLLCSFPETHFFSKGFGVARRNVVNKVLRGYYLYWLLENWIKRARRLGYDCEFNLTPCWSRNKMVRQFFALLDAMTINLGGRIWIEKTPAHVHFVDEIVRHLPEAKFIHLIRDGREVVASLYEAAGRYPEHWGGKRSIERCVKQWNACVRASKRYIGKSNHIFVAYEFVVKEPERYISKLVSFLGVEYDVNLLDQYHEEARKLIFEDEMWKRRNLAANGISGPGLSKYYKNFSNLEQSCIEKNLDWQTFDLLKEFAR